MRIQDVVLLVRDVHAQFERLDSPISVQDIRAYITDTLGIHVDAFDRVAYPGKYIMGRLLRYEQGGRKAAKIAVSENLNSCWTRFVACKELAHLLIDKDDGHFTSDPLKLVRGLIDSDPADAEQTYQADINSERLATIAAIELLIPWRYRDEIHRRMEDGENSYQIATRFKIPEKMVDMWVSETYQAVLERAWDGIG